MKKESRQMFMVIVLIFSLVLGTLVIPAGTVSQAAAKKLKVTASKTVAVNQTITIKTNVKAKFKSSDKKIATVSSKGVVKGKKAGKVKITVTAKSNKNLKKTVTITVKNQLVITAPKDAKATLQVGEQTKIKTNLTAKFASSNEKVATVSSGGTVTAKAAGTAMITVTSKKYKKLVKKVTITVKEKPATTTEHGTTEAKPTTEKVTTTEAPATEKVTTEEVTTTEVHGTEDGTTEEASTEEPKVVGIEANYGTNKVPYLDVDYLFSSRDISINLLYDDGTKEKLPINKSSLANVVKDNVEEVDYGAIVTYRVLYNELSCTMTIEYIYTDDIYPIGINVYSTGKTKKADDIELASDEYKVLVTYSDGSAEYVDNSNCRYAYIGKTDEKEYEYLVIYDCYYTDKNGNELYVGKSRYFNLPYE